MYVYKRSEPQLWTVGYVGPGGRWEPESDHDSPVSASARVIELNGGRPTGPASPEVPAAMVAAVLAAWEAGGIPVGGHERLMAALAVSTIVTGARP